MNHKSTASSFSNTDEHNVILKKEVENTVMSYIEVPIEVTGVQYSYILEPEIRRSEDLTGPLLGLDIAFGFIQANPKKEILRKAFELLYETNVTKNYMGEKALPSPKAFARLIKVLTNDKQPPDIFLIGDRGVGKSLVQNRLINIFLRKELIHQGYSFFRADVAKLHKFNKRISNKSSKGENRFQISSYMALHAFFVVLSDDDKNSFDPALKHFREDRNLLDNVNFKYEKNIDKLNTTFSKFLISVRNSEELLIGWAYVVDAFASRNTRDKKDPDEDIISFLVDCHRKFNVEYHLIEELFNSFLEFIKIPIPLYNGEIIPSTNVFLIVDGVDNLRIDDFKENSDWVGGIPSRSWYDLYLNDIQSMSRGRGISKFAFKTIFALRPDTYADLGNEPVEIQYKELRLPDSVFYVTAPNIKELFSRKLHAIHNDPTGSRFNSFELNADKWKKPDFLINSVEIRELFKLFCDRFFSAHIESVSRCMPQDTLVDYDSILLIVFNNNVRSLCRNVIRSFRYLHERLSTLPDKTDLKQRKDWFNELHPNTILEASLTGGHRYFIPNADDETKGRWCPNLFEFQNTPSGNWDGLAMVRLLQFLPDIDSPKQRPTEVGIKSQMSILGYISEQTQYVLMIASDFGLLRKKGTIVNNGHQTTYERTDKATYILSLFFSKERVYPQFHYLMSTGTKFNEIDHRDANNIIRRENKNWLHQVNHTHRNFWLCALKTCSLLFRHINTAQKLEKINSISSKINWDSYDINIARFSHQLVRSYCGAIPISDNTVLESLKYTITSRKIFETTELKNALAKTALIKTMEVSKKNRKISQKSKSRSKQK